MEGDQRHADPGDVTEEQLGPLLQAHLSPATLRLVSSTRTMSKLYAFQGHRFEPLSMLLSRTSKLGTAEPGDLLAAVGDEHVYRNEVDVRLEDSAAAGDRFDQHERRGQQEARHRTETRQ